MEQLGIFERTGRILEGLEGIFSEDALPNFLMFSAAAWVWISFDADWFVLMLHSCPVKTRTDSIGC